MSTKHSNSHKVCTQCKLVKPFSDFSKQAKRNDGLRYHCKQCDFERHKAYRHSKVGLLSVIYGSQNLNSKRRKHSPPDYTLNEFRIWALSHDKFHSLFDEWTESGYDINLTPSADRKDDYKTYAFDNLSWMTWAENKLKGDSDRKNGTNNKLSKAVVQMNLDGTYIAEYHSISHAALMTDGNQAHIVGCCLGKRKTHNGYTWIHAEDYLPTN